MTNIGKIDGIVVGTAATSSFKALASVNYGVLISDGSAIPSFLPNGTTGQVLTATTGGDPSWQPGGGGPGGITWTAVTSASNPVSLVTGNGYIATGAGVVNFVLPATSSVGDYFRIAGVGNLWTLTQNAGQSVKVGFVTSTIGVGGSVTATMSSDCIELLAVVANTQFIELSMQGNPIIV